MKLNRFNNIVTYYCISYAINFIYKSKKNNKVHLIIFK